jgi:triosephosphate isomerase (TIM)
VSQLGFEAVRMPVIAGNWKCNLRLDSAYQLANRLRERIEDIEGVEKIVCPSFIHIATVEVALSMSSIKVGAQDTHWEDDVAATGEVGPAQLEDLVDYVIIGHSERRHKFGETDEMVARKVKAALAVGLQPIMCVGETLEERQAGRTADVLLRQTRGGIEGLQQSQAERGFPDGFIVAYEPVWAIGTGTAATPEDAEEAIALVRREVASLLGDEKAETVRILYGGSVTPENIAELMSRDGIDGALVGGASLKVDSFAGIVEAAARVRAIGAG